jgi:hypothetical protein
MTEFDDNPLSKGAQKKLGSLLELQDLMIADAIRLRGDGQNQVDQLRSDYQTLTVGDLASLAAEGDPDAETAIKILKQAKKKWDKYAGK